METKVITYTEEALEYIADQANGGMRNAITMLDKCLAYSDNLTLENAVKVIGTSDISMIMDLIRTWCKGESAYISIIEEVYKSGADLKIFIRNCIDIALETYTYIELRNYYNLPKTKNVQEYLTDMTVHNHKEIKKLIPVLLDINNAIKWDTNPKTIIQAMLIGGQ